MSSTNATTCSRCGATVAVANQLNRCSPCARQDVSLSPTPVATPAGSWSSEAVRRATERRDFGLLLRSYRESFSPPITQGLVANWLGLSQAQVSRIEGGRTPVNDLTKLVRWADLLRIPEDVLWLSLPATDDVQLLDATSQNEVSSSSRNTSVLTSSLGRQHGGRRTGGNSESAGSSRVVTSIDVEAIREATGAFRQIDDRYGGGHVRSAVGAFLTGEVEPLLVEDRFSRGIRPHFQRAAVELHQLAGWMAYDVGNDLAGKQHLTEALNISVEAKAQGLALQGDDRGCINALRRAEHAFLAATAENTPPWLRYFDRAYLSAKFAQALLDLGRPANAERFARDSLKMLDGYDRGRLFNTALLASVLAEKGEVDEAVTLARSAAQMTGQIRSSRAHKYLRDVAMRLLPYSSDSGVRALRVDLDAARGSSLLPTVPQQNLQ